MDPPPFELYERIADGGAGQVWRGRHASGVPVAIKVLSPSSARDEQMLRAVRAEIRAVAGLRHPHVVWIHDHGVVDRATARRTGGKLAPGTPWLALELADGTLRDRLPDRWPDARQVLLELLDALGHAHARGIVHRDLKLDNVLVGGERPGVRLTDFGLAHVLEQVGAVAGGGTPSHMAPEQFDPTGADIGPWTDLFALGGLGWRIVTGHEPFPMRGAAPWTGRERSLPVFVPRFEVPSFVEAWLRWLLEPSLARRCPRAADAAGALLEHTAVPAWGAAPPPTRELPDDPVDPRPPGLSLFGLRAIPLVGRRAEREVLWDALSQVRATGEPRVVVLRGAAGCGKSRLAEWLCHEAHATGMADAARITHNPIGGPQDGLLGLVRRAVRAWLGDRAQVEARVERELARSGFDDLPAARVTQWARGEGEGLGAGRHAVARALIHPADRARVVWADDVQWGLDTLNWLADLASRPGPVLIVATVREEALDVRPDERGWIERLEASPGARRLDVGPLPAADRAELVHGLLGLDPALSSAVADRTGGNPLFLVQVLADWVEQQRLEASTGGFRLRDPERALPASLTEVWAGRVARLLAQAPAFTVPLELAAVLGQEVSLDEWEQVCASAGTTAPAELVDRLVELRLASSGEG
ncbi:MAG: protein kinase, partial [Myxococcota bacterium]